jgi:hypothetical protein
LFNIRQRQPSKTWQLIHLYRCGPSWQRHARLPYLFRVTGEKPKDVESLALRSTPVQGYGADQALDLVDYLVSQSYPIIQGDASAQEAR